MAEIKYLFVSLIRSLKGKQELLKKLQYIILVYFLSFWFTLAVLKCFTYCYSIFKLTYNNDNLLIIILLQQSAKTRQLATSLCCVVVLSPQGIGPLPHTHTHLQPLYSVASLDTKTIQVYERHWGNAQKLKSKINLNNNPSTHKTSTD